MVNIKFSTETKIAREDSKGGILRAIRKNCIECAGDSTDEAKYCSALDCQLWPYRLGRTPRSLSRKPEGKLLLDKAQFKAGGQFDPEKMAKDCRKIL